MSGECVHCGNPDVGKGEVEVEFEVGDRTASIHAPLCNDCHSILGVGINPLMPNIASYNEYLEKSVSTEEVKQSVGEYAEENIEEVAEKLESEEARDNDE